MNAISHRHFPNIYLVVLRLSLPLEELPAVSALLETHDAIRLCDEAYIVHITDNFMNFESAISKLTSGTGSGCAIIGLSEPCSTFHMQFIWEWLRGHGIS